MDFIKFWSAANKIAAKNFASLEDNGAEDFVRILFDEFKKEGDGLDCRNWLSRALKNSFISMNEPPRWVGEPFWPFSDGVPMIFFHQFKISIAARHMNFPLGDTIYIFGAKKFIGNVDFSVVYRIVSIDEDGCRSIPASGDIIF